MAHLTGNFTSEHPLSERVREAISAAFNDGWADPKKISQASHRALALREASLNEIGQVLRVAPSKIEVIGEPALLHHISLGGFLSQHSKLITSNVDVGKIRAVARSFIGSSEILQVSSDGVIPPVNADNNSVISLQIENGETGIQQPLENWHNQPGKIILDGTRTIPRANLLEGFSAATFEATSWNGPAGIGLLVINDEAAFKYPLPHIAPIRVPGSYSLPLLVGAAVALSEYFEFQEAIYIRRQQLAMALQKIDAITLIGYRSSDRSRYISAIVRDRSSEELLRSSAQIDQLFDAGSACSPENLQPSHVIASLGYSTAGHVRFTLHPKQGEDEITTLAKNLSEILGESRS